MKNHIICVVFFSVCLSCVSIKSVDDINRYHIVEVKQKNNTHKPSHVFTFQIHKDRSYFLNYLRDRYNHLKGFTPENFTAIIKDETFYVSVLSEEDSSSYLDLTDFIFKKKDPKLVKNGELKRFISITITDINGVDALETKSFYRNIVIKYLDDLRMGFKAY
ncbi:hypothetical protein [uncultured Psychroserpens sp.]|uniref:hypothetical protein n=1 Tax=uncultured Psychroserpens sp. TaxID=255436 RepID=UPI00260C1F5D|nr:hypothetical protein [uncultured Psychroserpens sp.]